METGPERCLEYVNLYKLFIDKKYFEWKKINSQRLLTFNYKNLGSYFEICKFEVSYDFPAEIMYIS